MKRAARARPNCSTMSFCTTGVAVAVSAMTGAGRSAADVLAEHPVVGAKIVSPLRDAVRLVDSDERGLTLGEHFNETGNTQPLRREEEELQLAVEVFAADFARGGAVHPGMNAADAQAERGELGELVFHERDERADDEGGSSADDGGKLVAERLAGAGGHDEQHVASGDGGFADFLLVEAEGWESEDGGEDFGGVVSD